jgi:hypothetical protein
MAMRRGTPQVLAAARTLFPPWNGSRGGLGRMASRTRLGESMRARKRSHSSLTRAHSPRRLAKGMRGLSPAGGPGWKRKAPSLGWRGKVKRASRPSQSRMLAPTTSPAAKRRVRGKTPSLTSRTPERRWAWMSSRTSVRGKTFRSPSI